MSMISVRVGVLLLLLKFIPVSIPMLVLIPMCLANGCNHEHVLISRVTCQEHTVCAPRSVNGGLSIYIYRHVL